MTDLGTLDSSDPANFSEANAINDSGQVVGRSKNADGEVHAFLWQNGVMTDLGTLPGGPNVSQNDSNALSINKTGTIVGYSSSANGTHPFVYKNGSWTDLGTLGGSSSGSLAYDVNDSDQVVGITQTPDQAFTAFFGSRAP